MIITKYKLCDFHTPDTNRHLCVSRDSVVDLLNSPELQKALRNRTLLGGLTHKSRDTFLTKNEEGIKSVGSHPDWLLTSADTLLCNCCLDVRLEQDHNGDEMLVGELLVFDNKPGKIVQMLIGAGVAMSVSLSVYSKIYNNQYNFLRLNGVDFTVTPALSAELLDVQTGITNEDVNPLS